MKRILIAATAVLLSGGIAVGQTQNPAPRQDSEESARKGVVPPSPSVGGAGTPNAGSANTTVQQADPIEAARKGGINTPTAGGAGTPNAGTANTTVQPADPTEAARKGGINQPSGAGGTAVR